MAGIILPRVNDLGKAGDEFFHGRASTLNPRLESSHASPATPVFNHQRHIRSPCGEPCVRLKTESNRIRSGNPWLLTCVSMISFADLIGFCDLTPDEVQAIAEHEN